MRETDFGRDKYLKQKKKNLRGRRISFKKRVQKSKRKRKVGVGGRKRSKYKERVETQNEI